MTANSYTGSITTDNQFEKISDVTNFTFTSGKTYSMQIQNIAEVKIADAIFTFENEKFQFTQGDDDIYIKTNGYVTLTILENV